jgi:hypothetical protein
LGYHIRFSLKRRSALFVVFKPIFYVIRYGSFAITENPSLVLFQFTAVDNNMLDA